MTHEEFIEVMARQVFLWRMHHAPTGHQTERQLGAHAAITLRAEEAIDVAVLQRAATITQGRT